MDENQCFGDTTDSGTFDSDLKSHIAAIESQGHVFLQLQSLINCTHIMQDDFFFSILANVASDLGCKGLSLFLRHYFQWVSYRINDTLSFYVLYGH